MTDQPAARGARDLLRIADFRRLYLAQAVSDVGDGMTYLALFLLLMRLSGSTALIALVSILVALPPVTIGLFAGAWADRSDRRRIMVASDALRAGIVLGLVPAALMGSVPLVLALAFVQAIVGTFFAPARGALVPKTIPESGLLAASSLGQSTRMISTVVGATATGALAAIAGIVWPVFILDAATFAVSVLLVVRVTPSLGRPDATAAARIRESGMTRAVRDGLGVIGRSGPLLAALGGITVTMLGVGAINVLFVPFLVRELGGSPAWAGPMEAAQTLSMVLAGALMTLLAGKLRAQTIFVASLAGVGVCIALLGASPNPVAMLALSFAVGWFVMPLQAVAMAIVAGATTDATRGRVAGAFNAITQTASIASMAVAGVFADILGMRVVFYAGGAVAATAAVVAWALFRWQATPGAEAVATAPHASTLNETGGAASMPHPPVGVAPG